MPPSASATPPTQTTQRVPNFSSKPIACGVDEWTSVGGESGTDGGGAGEGFGSAGATPIVAGAGAGSAVAGVAAPAATRAPSSAFILVYGCRHRLRSVLFL